MHIKIYLCKQIYGPESTLSMERKPDNFLADRVCIS